MSFVYKILRVDFSSVSQMTWKKYIFNWHDRNILFHLFWVSLHMVSCLGSWLLRCGQIKFSISPKFYRILIETLLECFIVLRLNLENMIFFCENSVNELKLNSVKSYLFFIEQVSTPAWGTRLVYFSYFAFYKSNVPKRKLRIFNSMLFTSLDNWNYIT